MLDYKSIQEVQRQIDILVRACDGLKFDEIKAKAKGTSVGLRAWYASMSDSERQAIVTARLKKAWATRRANG